MRTLLASLLLSCLLQILTLNALAAQDEPTLCADTGGSFTECGASCELFTCDNPSIDALGFPAPCTSECSAQCTCPLEAPLWDAAKGCMSASECAPTTLAGEQNLCASSGGEWTTCGSGCGPMACGQDPSEFDVCPPSCELMCKCPADAPYWDEAIGCHNVQDCEALCVPSESWNSELSACCPDAYYESDCLCPEGTLYQPSSDYDEHGCFLGYGCECVPEQSLECGEGESWDASVGACCGEVLDEAFCGECEGGEETLQVNEEYDEKGCLLAYSCECVPCEGAACGDSPEACDDGTPLECFLSPPSCDEGLILALQEGCYLCVDPLTCEAPESALSQAICEASGGVFSECGDPCMVFTCEQLPDSGPVACTATSECTAVCECPEGAPIWDELLGCIKESECSEGSSVLEEEIIDEEGREEEGAEEEGEERRPSNEASEQGEDSEEVRGETSTDSGSEQAPAGSEGSEKAEGGSGCQAAAGSMLPLWLALLLSPFILRRRARKALA